VPDRATYSMAGNQPPSLGGEGRVRAGNDRIARQFRRSAAGFLGEKTRSSPRMSGPRHVFPGLAAKRPSWH
jgi:hypothetical protein